MQDSLTLTQAPDRPSYICPLAGEFVASGGYDDNDKTYVWSGWWTESEMRQLESVELTSGCIMLCRRYEDMIAPQVLVLDWEHFPDSGLDELKSKLSEIYGNADIAEAICTIATDGPDFLQIDPRRYFEPNSYANNGERWFTERAGMSYNPALTAEDVQKWRQYFEKRAKAIRGYDITEEQRTERLARLEACQKAFEQSLVD